MIEAIAGFLQHHLIVLVAVVLVPTKFGVLRICNDRDAQKAALLAIPEDLVYVSLGLILGDFATSGGAFRRHFRNSEYIPMDLFVTVAIGLTVAILIHFLAKWTNDNMSSWRAATETHIKWTNANPLQGELGLQPSDESIRMIQMRHLAGASVGYAVQLGIAIKWLAWIAGVLANG